MSGQTYKADGRSALQIQLKTGSGVNWSTVGSGTGWVAELRPEGSPSVTAPSATFNITVSGATMTLTLSDPSPLLRGSRTTYGWALYDGAGAPILTDMAVELHDGYTHPSGTPSPSGATPVGTYTVDLGTATGNLVVNTVWTGPQGPQGPQGAPGDLTRAVADGIYAPQSGSPNYVQTPAASVAAAPQQAITQAQVADLLRRVGALENANRFPYKRTVTVDNTAGPAKATAWQVKVALTSANMNFAHARYDGKDIQFRDASGVILPSWIESYDQAGQTATIWVRIAPIGTTTATLTMLYGNPSYTSPFAITDVFPTGVEWPHLRDNWTHPTLSAQTIIFVKDEAWEQSSGAHTFDVVDFGTPGKVAPNGQTYRFWGWYGHYGADGIGLAFANDPAGPWTKYASNPILGAAANARWATVQQADDGTLHMLIQNTNSNTVQRYTLSADGITATLVETVVADTGYNIGNPTLFRDPATSDYFLYYQRAATSTEGATICYRRATSIPALTQARPVKVNSSPLVWAAPQVCYFDGLYWLYCEDYNTAPSNGQFWRTVVSCSPRPEGPFAPCSNALLLTDDQPCTRGFVFDGTLYIYNAQRNNNSNSDWSFGVHTAVPRKGKQTSPATLAYPTSLHPYTGTELPQVQVDTSVGAAAKSQLVARLTGGSNVDTAILADKQAPADCVFVATIRRNGNNGVFMGARANQSGARYRFGFNGTTAWIATITGWGLGNTNLVSPTHGQTLNATSWYKVEARMLGSALSLYLNGTQIATATDATYNTAGYCTFEAPNTDFSVQYAYARAWDGTDPTVAVGSEAAS